jgi:hypothetical protein
VTRAAIVIRSLQGDAPLQCLDRYGTIIVERHALAARGTSWASLRIVTPAVFEQQGDQLAHQQPALFPRLLLNLTQGRIRVLPFPLLQTAIRRAGGVDEQLLLSIRGRRRCHGKVLR